MCLVEQAIHENGIFTLFFYLVSIHSPSLFQKIVQYCFILEFYSKKSCSIVLFYDSILKNRVKLLKNTTLLQENI